MFSSLYDFFKNKRVLILGLGRECRSTLEILKKIPCTIGISDKNLTVTEDIKEYELYSGEDYLDCIDNFDTLYVTTATLQKDYAQYSSSLLNLIKRSEESISRTRAKYRPDSK